MLIIQTVAWSTEMDGHVKHQEGDVHSVMLLRAVWAHALVNQHDCHRQRHRIISGSELKFHIPNRTTIFSKSKDYLDENFSFPTRQPWPRARRHGKPAENKHNQAASLLIHGGWQAVLAALKSIGDTSQSPATGRRRG